MADFVHVLKKKNKLVFIDVAEALEDRRLLDQGKQHFLAAERLGLAAVFCPAWLLGGDDVSAEEV